MIRRLEAVCRAHHVLKKVPGPIGLSAIDKRPTTEAVQVDDYGLHGDIQAARRYHGGVDKAIYAMDSAECAYWREWTGRDFSPGYLGENLQIASRPGIDDAEIGERWRIGDITVEVTGPRNPCATFSYHMGIERFHRIFRDRGRPGVYLKVLSPGTIQVGDEVRVIDRPGHGVSIAQWFAHHNPADARAILDMHDSGRITVAHYTLKYLIAAVSRES